MINFTFDSLQQGWVDYQNHIGTTADSELCLYELSVGKSVFLNIDQDNKFVSPRTKPLSQAMLIKVIRTLYPHQGPMNQSEYNAT